MNSVLREEIPTTMPDFTILHTSKDLMRSVQKLESSFSLGRVHLRKIVDQFCLELKRGLTTKDASIPMNPTWVMGIPSGYEEGKYITLDLGGTNLRVALVELTSAKGGLSVHKSLYHLPEKLKTGSSEDLWDFIASSIDDFLTVHGSVEAGEQYPLAFTFSFPCTQDYIDHGILQRWTKGFNIVGVEGHDVVPMIRAALARRKLRASLVALVNDTTATLVASTYVHGDVDGGCIMGTGCNAAYFENFGSIPKIHREGITADTLMAINCEWGAFDNEHKILPRTDYDVLIDRESPRPGQQSYEKMVSGLYLGEIFRLAILDLGRRGSLFLNQDLDVLEHSFCFATEAMAQIESDMSNDRIVVRSVFQHQFGLDCDKIHSKLIQHISWLVSTRAARLFACGIAAICQKKGISSGRFAVDGAVFKEYPEFQKRVAEALREIYDWPNDTEHAITLRPAADDSSVGAAVTAALTTSGCALRRNS